MPPEYAPPDSAGAQGWDLRAKIDNRQSPSQTIGLTALAVRPAIRQRQWAERVQTWKSECIPPGYSWAKSGRGCEDAFKSTIPLQHDCIEKHNAPQPVGRKLGTTEDDSVSLSKLREKTDYLP